MPNFMKPVGKPLQGTQEGEAGFAPAPPVRPVGMTPVPHKGYDMDAARKNPAFQHRPWNDHTQKKGA